MALFDLLNALQSCTKLKINIVSPYMPEVKEKINDIKIYSNYLLDDICESTLKKIEVDLISLYSEPVTCLSYIKVFISAKTKSALLPLITRLNYEYERNHR